MSPAGYWQPRAGFTQITLGVPLGVDILEVIDLWSNEIFPALR
ncbi:MAG TPA: hypothetical protein VMR20_10680 [Verrucomicrobiae bacterium]|nr:hypothetical protein [Verrucomicrobiae bacterium]